jgi:hypothetical protein
MFDNRFTYPSVAPAGPAPHLAGRDAARTGRRLLTRFADRGAGAFPFRRPATDQWGGR